MASFITKLLTEFTEKTTAEDTDLVPVSDTSGNLFKMTFAKLKELLNKNGKYEFTIGDGSVNVQLRKNGNSGTEALSLVSNYDGNTTFNQLINADGSCNFPKLSNNGKAVGSAAKPVYVNASGNITACTGSTVLGFQKISGNSGSVIAPGKTAQIKATFKAVSGATQYVAIPLVTSYGAGVMNLSISGTTLTANMISIYETHTLSGIFLILALAV